ncbi:RNA polymerase sigma factor [Longimicrobium sp.]|uniref:RNA polymerase sigma factor n=1 Tax=Longimicrobium sp. TaxID=2029185 RepID=UPI002BC18316|nr:RNA polymerase sigma factor [Longimicrobium sp.]HSU13669.1 RNA polymerase sigma factor [Longimicrobium sp.]
MHADLTDPELIGLARAGDERAFRELVERHESAVAATVIGMLGPGDDADDVGQETFIRFYRALGDFRGEAAVRTYLRRIAMNLSLNALKRRRRFAFRFPSRDREPLPEPAVEGGVEVESREAQARVRAAIDRLGPKHRPVVVLRMIEGCSTRETAEVLGVPEGTVLSRLSRAMEQLAAELRSYATGADEIQEGRR